MATTATFLSPNICRLVLYCKNRIISNGTGFFIENDDKWFLASNWHILSGRHPNTGQPLHTEGAIPDRVQYHKYELGETFINTKTLTVPLIDKESGDSLWLQHPSLGQDADIAVLPLEEVGIARKLLERDGYDPDFYFDAGYEVFILRYPLGIGGPGHFPIWKRASVATSPEVGDLRTFLVDTASREGMSGSPCFAISNWKHYRRNPETSKMVVVHRPISHRLLGVYSGRINPSDQLEAQLGIVWRDTLLFEVLKMGVPGNHKIRKGR